MAHNRATRMLFSRDLSFVHCSLGGGCLKKQTEWQRFPLKPSWAVRSVLDRTFFYEGNSQNVEARYELVKQNCSNQF